MWGGSVERIQRGNLEWHEEMRDKISRKAEEDGVKCRTEVK